LADDPNDQFAHGPPGARWGSKNPAEGLVPDDQAIRPVGQTAVPLEEATVCPTNPEGNALDKQRRIAFHGLA
jgi:hypothetical protein